MIKCARPNAGGTVRAALATSGGSGRSGSGDISLALAHHHQHCCNKGVNRSLLPPTSLFINPLLPLPPPPLPPLRAGDWEQLENHCEVGGSAVTQPSHPSRSMPPPLLQRPSPAAPAAAPAPYYSPCTLKLHYAWTGVHHDHAMTD